MKDDQEKDSVSSLRVELEAIKRLLIFALIKNGASQSDVAIALGVNQSTISRFFPKRK